MAIATTMRHTGNGGTTGSQTQVTNSTTATASSLLIAVGGVQCEATDQAFSWQTPTGGGLTYTSVREENHIGAGGTYRVGTQVFRAPISASPAAHTITFDAWSTTQTGWYSGKAFDITGHNTTTPIVQTAGNSGQGAGSDTVAATIVLGGTPVTGNEVIAIFTVAADSGGGFAIPTAGGGNSFTAINNENQAYTQIGIFKRTWTGGESLTITCSDLGQACYSWSAVAFEVAVAAGAAATSIVVPSRAGFSKRNHLLRR